MSRVGNPGTAGAETEDAARARHRGLPASTFGAGPSPATTVPTSSRGHEETELESVKMGQGARDGLAGTSDRGQDGGRSGPELRGKVSGMMQS